MTKVMKSILSRVLSQEIAHQEEWHKQDIELFGEDKIGRDGIIKEIKDFMSENGVDFNYDWYLNA